MLCSKENLGITICSGGGSYEGESLSVQRVFARRRLSRPNDRWYYANAVVKNSKFWEYMEICSFTVYSMSFISTAMILRILVL
ncbi:hypothetical protein P029_03235 [Anaplasma phagocytophilum str. Norway variant2]|uniref:Uncharacterized protein n=1 Tax=Anaplasma phagocytophilum str. Norway variant2 TaxID=1392507 RepID=A0A161IK40_ANAPH|nr:hypothetical protein P029_03235 [Anaplasma phagocytophilum str. Norway variant2]